MFIYDGTSSDLVGEVGSPAHSGGVYGVAWSPDGKQLLTASGDKTAKLWDVETRQIVSEFVLGNTVEDQQVSKRLKLVFFFYYEHYFRRFHVCGKITTCSLYPSAVS